MERLTVKQKDGTIVAFDEDIIDTYAYQDSAGNRHPVYTGNAIDLLSQYEDTNLSPQEIEKLIEENKALKARINEMSWEISGMRSSRYRSGEMGW